MAESAGVKRGLSGIRIIDFGQYIAGPLAAVMLADQGADVIHVDPPGGPRWKRDSDAFLNRSKRRITLDLKKDEDLQIAKRLIASADVLIENFRPGVMDRLGLGWETVKELAPQLIYVSLPGFGSDDTRANIPGWEGVIAAATGNAMVRQGQAPEGWDISKPTYSSIPVGSNFAAFLSCTATVSALTARHYTGRGQRIELPLFNAMFEVIGGAGAYLEANGMPPAGEMRPRGPNGSGTYQCKDGRWVQFNPIGTSMRFVRWVLDEAGVAAEFAKEGLTEGVKVSSDPATLKRLCDKLEAMFLTKTAKEWEDLGHRAGSPLAFIRKGSEWLESENARAARQVVKVDDPEYGETWMAGLPVHTLQSSAQEPRARSLPDADRAEILAELETLKPREIKAANPAQKSPYENLRVLDLTEILAGPTSGRILGEYGANVVKINSPMRGAGGNGGMNMTHNILNRGKRTILLNIETERGQEVFWKLVENADVITQNYPRGTADRYGIGYEHVKARRPEIVYVSVSCYGYGGGWDGGRGYETQGQAVSGVMERAGGDNYPPEIIGPYNVLDYGTGVMASFAASLGIYHQTVYGEGQQVTAALAQTGTYQGSSYLINYDGKVWDEPRGPECLGTGVLQRFYEAQDGWFFLGARDDQVDVLAGVKGLDIDSSVWSAGGAGLESTLENALSGQSVSYWVGALQDAGVGAYEIVTLEDLMVDEQVRQFGLSVTQAIEGTGNVVMPGLTARLSDTPARLGKPVRQPGGDAREVLAEIGMADKVDALDDAWILRVPPEVAPA